MYEVGNIIYFTPFYFKNGRSAAKPKYFVVLKIIDGKTILASLPTRNDCIPEKETVEKGCVELPDINMNCYVFAACDPVTKCGKYFDFKTHIYGYQLDDHNIESLNEIYVNEGVDYEIFGKLKDDIFTDLIECLKNSRSVKRKYVRILNS